MKIRPILSALFLLTASWLTAQMPMASSHAPSAVAALPSGNVVVPHPSGKPVVRINGVVLTDRDLVNEEYAIFPYGRTHNGIPTGAEPDIRRGAMKMIVFEELVYQEAQRQKLSVSAAKVDKAMAEYRKQFPSPDQYKAVLRTDYDNSEQKLRDTVKRSLTIDAFLAARGGGQVGDLIGGGQGVLSAEPTEVSSGRIVFDTVHQHYTSRQCDAGSVERGEETRRGSLQAGTGRQDV